MNIDYFKKQCLEIQRRPSKLFNKLNYHTFRYLIRKFLESSEYGFMNRISGISRQDFNRFLREISRDSRFISDIGKRYLEVRDSNIPFQDWHKVMYILVRSLKPEVIVETGVFEGISTVLILRALEKNNKGKLISLDIPPKKSIKNSTSIMRFPQLPEGLSSGWLVPERYKLRWELTIGDTRKILKEILEKEKEIDMFLHDSLHTHEHMLFEYKIAWPYIRKNGLLLSDDIYFSRAFSDFSQKISKKYHVVHGFGGLIK